MDLLAADAVTMSQGMANRTIYPAHLPIGDILTGIKTKKYFRGTIRVKRDCWWETYVVVHTLGPNNEELRRSVAIVGASFSF